MSNRINHINKKDIYCEYRKKMLIKTAKPGDIC